jgi:thiol-disulfide isomerase/thioredoxin
MDKTIRIVGAVLAVVLLGAAFFFIAPLLIPANGPSTVNSPAAGTVYFFYGEECPHCHEVRPFIDNLSQKYPDVEFRMLETWHNDTNNALSVSFNRQLGVTQTGVPEVIVGDTALFGSRDIPAKLEAAILEQKKKF